jgi:hypothetical protein
MIDMSLSYDESYEPTNDMEIGELLAELPLDLINATIDEQINDPMLSNVNYVNIIVDKCEIYKKLFTDEDALRQVNHTMEVFFEGIIKKINDRFDLGVDIESLVGSSDLVEIAQVLYDYFIIRYKKNISKVITNYIKKNKSDLVEYYLDRNKKDVTTLSHKKQIKDTEDLTILSNLPSIINYIITSVDITPYEFVDLSAGSSNYNACIIKRLISNNQMIGNFVLDYFKVSTDEHDYLLDEIHTDIKMRLVKKVF